MQRGNYWGSRGHIDSVWGKGKVRYAHGTEDSDLPGAGWLSTPPVSGGLFDLFQMSPEEEDVLVLLLEDSDSECFDTVEAGSSVDAMDDCLSVVSEVEGLAVAEPTGPKISKVPAGTEAQGSDELIVSGPKSKGRSRYGPGRAKHRKRQALSRQESKGDLCRGKPEENRSHLGTPPVWGVLWRGVWSASLTCGDTVFRHTSPRFCGTGVTRGRILGGSWRLHCRRS